MTVNIADVVKSVAEEQKVREIDVKPYKTVREMAKDLGIPYTPTREEVEAMTPVVNLGVIKEEIYKIAEKKYAFVHGKKAVPSDDELENVVKKFFITAQDLLGGNTPVEYINRYENGEKDVLEMIKTNPLLVL